MTSILVTGYKNFELGIFNDKDPKIEIIKKAIKKNILRYCDQGLDWLVFTGNLGFEFWAFEVAQELKSEYNFQLAVIFPFQTHGQNWNEGNQMKLATFKQADFLKYSYETYQSPGQFRKYQQFLINNTNQAYVFYDPEAETNLKSFIKQMTIKRHYPVDFLTFEKLNEILEED
ncbi:SLOG family protein [Streptococcus dentapri]|uniref:UPF0398 protein ACFOSE_00550 n=1 Tax=Streptococcus dentapri TaxID=573564 RepID=A0ABV8CZK4_9STRE